MESTPVLATVSTTQPLVNARRGSYLHAQNRGISLVEMVVVLAIITIITGIALSGQSTYNKSLLLTNTTYSLAFTARQAQSFGLASRKFGSVQNPGYGIHLDKAYLNSYTFFADTNATLPASPACPLGTINTPERKPGNCRFDALDGVVQKYTFTRGFKIQSFCARYGSGLNNCSTDSIGLSDLDIVFTRPNTSASMTGTIAGTVYTFTCAEITLADPTGTATKSMRISQLGEIAINQTCS